MCTHLQAKGQPPCGTRFLASSPWSRGLSRVPAQPQGMAKTNVCNSQQTGNFLGHMRLHLPSLDEEHERPHLVHPSLRVKLFQHRQPLFVHVLRLGAQVLRIEVADGSRREIVSSLMGALNRSVVNSSKNVEPMVYNVPTNFPMGSFQIFSLSQEAT